MARTRTRRSKTSSILDSTRIPLFPGTAAATPSDFGQLLGRRLDLLWWILHWREIIAEILRFIRWHRLDFSMQHQQQSDHCEVDADRTELQSGQKRAFRNF